MGISLLKPFFLIKKNPRLITTNLCLVNRWIFFGCMKIQIINEMVSIWMKSLKKRKNEKLKNLNLFFNKKSVIWQVQIDVELVPSHTLGLGFLKQMKEKEV